MKLTWNATEIKPITGRIEYKANHAAIVELGAILRNGTDYPARPYMRTTINETDFDMVFLKNFNGDVESAFKALVHDVANGMQLNIMSERWDWPRETNRSGRIVGSPRDIVHTSELKNSQEVSFS